LPVQDSPHNGNISEFLPIGRATQHQSTAAHVAAPNEIDRETKPVFEMFKKDIDIFSGGDAAQ